MSSKADCQSLYYYTSTIIMADIDLFEHETEKTTPKINGSLNG